MDIRDWLTRAGRFLRSVGVKAGEDRIFGRAASLAFSTLLSLVPLTMVVYSFGGFDQLGSRLLQDFARLTLPEGQQTIVDLFAKFTENARRLGAWGSILFLLAAVLLLNSVERNFNDVFFARPHRGPLVRLGLYIASLALISLLFGAGFGPLASLADTWKQALSPENRPVIGGIASLLTVALGLYVLYSMLTAAKIRRSCTMIGALTGAVVFQAAKYAFAFWATRSVRQSIIYGSLVFFPLLLIWLNLAWIVILGGAEIAWAIHSRAGRLRPLPPGTPADELETGWNIYLALAAEFRAGGAPPTVYDLAARLDVPERRAADLLDRLEAGALIHRLPGDPSGWIPAMAPGDLEAARVFSVIAGWDPEGSDIGDGAPALLRKGARRALGHRSVASFADPPAHAPVKKR